MDQQLTRRERREARRDGEPLKRPIRALVHRMGVDDRRVGCGLCDARLDVVLDRIVGLAIAAREEVRPQRAGVADEQADGPRVILQPRHRRFARDDVRRERVHDVEPAVGKARGQRRDVHVVTVPQGGRGGMLSRMPATLHRELLGDPAAACLVLTHGIYGAGTNWRGIARKVVNQRPDWSIALVDLRNHGRSTGPDAHIEPPHTLAACAADVAALFDELPTLRAIAGHSFGGKVALATRAIAPERLVQTWMFDSSPSARPGAEEDPDNSVTRVLHLMEKLPKEWGKREEFIAAVVAEGHAAPFAQWLAMNVVPADDGVGDRYVLRLDLAAIREMLRDYYAQDLWPVAFDPARPGSLEIVIAEQSPTLDAADRERLAGPGVPDHVHVHRIDSGHWLHIEAGANVVELLVRGLPTSLS